MLQIVVANSGRELREFIELPAQIYAPLPEFEAPLHIDRALLLDPKHSALWKSARVCYWLARRDGKPVGRISAQAGSVLPVGVAPGSGMFGCLDAVDDLEVVRELATAAERWLIEQGCSAMFGPCTLDMNDEPGLLVAGWEQPAMTLCPWHPPYLGGHLEALNFVKLRDLHNWRRDVTDAPMPGADVRRRLAERIPGLRVRYPVWRKYARDIQVLCDVYNDGWRDHWGFIPLTPEDLAGLDQLMKWLVPRDAFKIVELNGTPIAVLLLIPNLFELTRGLGPSPGIGGWAKLLWRAATHHFTSGRIIVLGVARHLQSTLIGAAVAGLLIDELIASIVRLKGQWVEAGWVLENNTALIQILESFDFARNKTFRIYHKPLTIERGAIAEMADS